MAAPPQRVALTRVNVRAPAVATVRRTGRQRRGREWHVRGSGRHRRVHWQAIKGQPGRPPS